VTSPLYPMMDNKYRIFDIYEYYDSFEFCNDPICTLL